MSFVVLPQLGIATLLLLGIVIWEATRFGKRRWAGIVVAGVFGLSLVWEAVTTFNADPVYAVLVIPMAAILLLAALIAAVLGGRETPTPAPEASDAHR